MNRIAELESALDRQLIRELVEAYLVSVDSKDWDGIEAVFTPDAVARYNNETAPLSGASTITDRLRRMEAYSASNHVLSCLKVVVEGDQATAEFNVLATLHAGEIGTGRVQGRSVHFVDKLVRAADGWKVSERVHEPMFQYELVSEPLRLYRWGDEGAD